MHTSILILFPFRTPALRNVHQPSPFRVLDGPQTAASIGDGDQLPPIGAKLHFADGARTIPGISLNG